MVLDHRLKRHVSEPSALCTSTAAAILSYLGNAAAHGKTFPSAGYPLVRSRRQHARPPAAIPDSRQPTRVFLGGDYELSDELKPSGTVPQYGGIHRCALKFKAWMIETWLDANIRGRARHALGYNANETGRIAKSHYAFRERIAFGLNAEEAGRINRSCEYNTVSREAFYPLLEWGWNRKRCLDYIQPASGVVWRKSTCVFGPFNTVHKDAMERSREHPAQVADAMTLEHMSLARRKPSMARTPNAKKTNRHILPLCRVPARQHGQPKQSRNAVNYEKIAWRLATVRAGPPPRDFAI